MALDAYRDIWGKALLRCPDAGSELARDWVNNAFRQIAERRRWSWLYKFGQFVLPALYNTGTVSVTQGSNVVTGTGTAWTGDMLGRQFRIGVNAPIYTIQQTNSATSLSLDSPWGGASATTQGYSIYQAYVTPPADFHAFVSIWDPNYNWRLWTNVPNSEIDLWDAQRSNTSQSYCTSFRDFSMSQVGVVAQPVRVLGAGNIPGTSGTYTAPSDSLFTVQITTTGAPGTAVYKWSKDGGAFTTGVVTDSGSNAESLSDGAQIYFPAGVSYTSGDTFIIRATAGSAPGLPRYELWPHQTAQYVYPFLYEARATDLSDPGATLPRYIRGDVVLEGALAEAARWPGPSADKKNPYFDLNLWKTHNLRFESMVMEMERQDDEQNEQNVRYASIEDMPWAPFGDSAWLQRHAV